MHYDIYLRDYIFSLSPSNIFNYYYLCYIVYIILFSTYSSLSDIASGGFSLNIADLYVSSIYNYFVTPIIEVMYNVHREYYIILTAILVLILYILYIELTVFRDIDNRFSINNHFILELVWSILPALIILHFMMMTIALLYVSDEHPFFGFHIKVIGHQWYWEYEIVRCFSSVESIYTNMSEATIIDGDLPVLMANTICGSSRRIDNVPIVDYAQVKQIKEGIYLPYYKKIKHTEYNAERLLDTEGVLYVPYRIHVRLLITSMDVIHSFTIPSLGIKADAIPGRLNDLHFFLTDNSAMTHYFGQCSELCGVGHAFMPIHMVSI